MNPRPQEGRLHPGTKGLLIGAGVLVIAALLWETVGRRMNLGRLPGNIRIEGEHTRFYFPVVTCLLISAVLTLGGWVVRLFQK